MQRTVVIKLDGEIIRTEMAIPNQFTGEVMLRFHWRKGQLMRAEAQKNQTAEISTDLPTLTRGNDSAILEE